MSSDNVDLEVVVGGPDGLDPSVEVVRLGGRVIAQRHSRDLAVVLGEKVGLEAGSFPPAGGAKWGPLVGYRHTRAVLHVFDVPRLLAVEFVADHGGAVRILPSKVGEGVPLECTMEKGILDWIDRALAEGASGDDVVGALRVAVECVVARRESQGARGANR